MGFLDMPRHYANRNELQPPFVTKAVIAASAYAPSAAEMLDKGTFLSAVDSAAPSRAHIARTLGVAPARITELMKGERDLKYDEALKLSRVYGIDRSLSAGALKPVLAVCLRHAPKGGWSDRDVERLAEEIEYGLSLWQSLETSSPSQDAQALAERVIADRLRDSPE